MRKLAALVIGNANYTHAGLVLRNPVNDACDMADKLVGCGFDVKKITDATYQEMEEAIVEFHAALKAQDVGLFFYAGHGVQIQGENYLIAVDTRVATELAAKHSSLSLNYVIDHMEDAGPATSIIILDACRNNPWARQWRRIPTDGLAPVYAPKGTLIAYSTSPGQFAGDGEGRNGAYTAALLQHLDAPEVPVETMFKRVRNTLAATTDPQQISWEHTSLAGDFFFKLSIASEIREYGATALSDRLFVLGTHELAHKIIRGLKVLTWGRQNAALEEFNPVNIGGDSADSLFVLGRNIYQAACGSARAAVSFITHFIERTVGLDVDARKAILDGMLFEIFFGADGQLREYPKTMCFNEVFQLQCFDELKPSFDFIANCLTPASNRFYVIPGSGHEVAVTVNVDPQNADAPNLVTGVFFSGVNVLREMEDIVIRRNWSKKMTAEQLAEELSLQMLVPMRLLKVTTTPSDPNRHYVELPRDHTVRKPSAT